MALPRSDGGGRLSWSLYLVLNAPSDFVDVLGEYVFLGTTTVLGVAASGGQIGGTTHGKCNWNEPGASIKTLEVSVTGCKCCIDEVEFQFGQTVYLPKLGDVLVVYGGFFGMKKKNVTVTDTDVYNIADHEYVHAVATETIAGALFPKAESDCTGKCWEDKKPWTEKACKSLAKGKLQEAITYFYDKAGAAGVEWHSYTGYGSFGGSVTKKKKVKYFNWLPGKIDDWKKKKVCQK